MACGLVASLPTMKLDSVVVETTFGNSTGLNVTKIEEWTFSGQLVNETIPLWDEEDEEKTELSFPLMLDGELRFPNSTFLLKQALLVPLFNMLTNSSVVSEEMPLVEKFMLNKWGMNSTGLVNTTFLDSKKEELRFLSDKKKCLKNKINALQQKITSEMNELRMNESEIIDTKILAEKLEILELTAESRGNKILDKLEVQLNGTFSDMLTNQTWNTTFLSTIFNETLSDEERVELLAVKMLNETTEKVVVSELRELTELDAELESLRENATALESFVLSKVDGTMELVTKIKENESKFQNMLAKLTTDLDEIENVTLKINETETEMIRETEKDSFKTYDVDYEDSEEYDGYETPDSLLEYLSEKSEAEKDEKLDMQVSAIHVRGISEKLVDYFEKQQQEEQDALFEFITNIYCTLTEKYQYFKSHPTDITKYVECDPFGKGAVKSCPEGRLWDNFHEICTIKSVVKEGEKLTEMFFELENIEKNLTSFDCESNPDMCKNGGRCIQGSRCECTDGFMGDFCMEKVVANSIYSEIMQNKFDLTEFREMLRMDKTLTKVGEKEMKNIKSFFKGSTHEEIMAYLDMFGTGETRYDIIMNELIDVLLQDIYPEAYYMSFFNASSGSRLIDVVRLIPSLIQYTRFSEIRYTDVFLKYQQVLVNFVENMNGTWKNVGEQATQYVKVTSHVMNETGLIGMDEMIASMNKTTEEEVLETLEAESDRTSEENTEFYMELESLRIRLIDLMKREPECMEKELTEIKGSDDVLYLIKIFEGLRVKNLEIVNSLLSYGFWFVTDSFAGHF